MKKETFVKYAWIWWIGVICGGIFFRFLDLYFNL
jgi:hypothetical protein